MLEDVARVAYVPSSSTDISEFVVRKHDRCVSHGEPSKDACQAVWQITLADVSMSLDNVLAVAGAAREHPMILIFGLALSIALMGLAANFIARLLEKHRWIAYVGLAIILYVAFDMCYRGALEVWPHLNV